MAKAVNDVIHIHSLICTTLGFLRPSEPIVQAHLVPGDNRILDMPLVLLIHL